MPIRPRRPMLALVLCALAAPGAAEAPAPDCAQADPASAAACADARQGALAGEVARLGGLVAEAGGAVAPGAGPDGCGESGAGACSAAGYAAAIHGLRESLAALGREDAAGLSQGPESWICDGLDAPLRITFITTDPGLVAIGMGDEILVLSQEVAASGVRYVSEAGEGGRALFWSKGRQALFAPPGGPELACATPAAQ